MNPFKKARRSRPEIIRDILLVAKGGANKTRIVYKANLNFKFLDRYLETLIPSGMIEQRGRIWRTTLKGLTYIARFHDMAILEVF